MFSCLLCCLLCFAKGVVTQEEQQPPEMPQRLKWSETGRSPLRVPLSKPKEALHRDGACRLCRSIAAGRRSEVAVKLTRAREGAGVYAGWLSGGRESKAPRDDGQRLLLIATSSEGTSLARRGDPATVGKINIDLVLVLVQHNGSRSGKEEEPSLHVGEKGQR
ncbi:hypothetical protein BHE74_00049737 [Ensete ventricosum]|nr:hypothetical protein BHE74_00049737 [Ensete ventricosum]RZS11737.1 hypothetical protein BHM03_00043102 [Ensete ventricosum]